MSSRIKFTHLEKSWITYDWANSVYATIMAAVIFPIYFIDVATGAGVQGDFWWGIATAVSTAIVAIFAPVLGALADFKGMKKKLFSGFLIVGVSFTVFSAVVDDWRLLMLGYALSYIGFAGSNLFYDSFLTDVTTPKRMDSVSAWGYSMGYIGGSTIPFIISIVIITFAEQIGISGGMAVKIAVIICAVWWAVFSIPVLKNVEQKYYSEDNMTNLIRKTFSNVFKTGKEIIGNKAIIIFIIAYFFYIDGVNTVITMSTAYGATLGLDTTGMILALLVTQLVAFPCAILFSRAAKKFGSITMLITAVMVYFVICILGFIMGFGLEEGFLTLAQALNMFWALAILVGTAQGGIQALSRSYYGKIVPPEKSGEYFGFFDIFGKFAAILGPLIYAFVKYTTGRSSLAIGALILLFGIAAVILISSRKLLVAAENRRVIQEITE